MAASAQVVTGNYFTFSGPLTLIRAAMVFRSEHASRDAITIMAGRYARAAVTHEHFPNWEFPEEARTDSTKQQFLLRLIFN